MASSPGWSAGLSVHPLTKVAEPPLSNVDIDLGQPACPLLQCVEEDEQVPGPLIQDPVEVSSVVASQLAELPIDLRAVRERERRVVAGQAIQEADLVVDLLLSFRCEAVDEVVDRLPAVLVAVVQSLHVGECTKRGVGAPSRCVLEITT